MGEHILGVGMSGPSEQGQDVLKTLFVRVGFQTFGAEYTLNTVGFAAVDKRFGLVFQRIERTYLWS